jgi:hypothetical protein
MTEIDGPPWFCRHGIDVSKSDCEPCTQQLDAWLASIRPVTLPRPRRIRGSEYERGYMAGYRAGRRHAEKRR